MQQIHIFVTGKVQGVGFRATVKRHAQLYQIKGYVRNLLDGRVEICAQANGEQIHEFLQIIQQRPGSALIEAVETKYKPAQEFFSSFDIR
jgi:acylphosphatase